MLDKVIGKSFIEIENSELDLKKWADKERHIVSPFYRALQSTSPHQKRKSTAREWHSHTLKSQLK